MLKIAFVVLGLLLATCGPAENAKLPGGATPGTGGATGGTVVSGGSGGGGTNPFAGATGGSAGTAGSSAGSGGYNPFGGGSGGSNTGGTAGKGGSGGTGGRAGSGGAGSGGAGSGGTGSGGVPADGSRIPNIAIPAGVEPCANPKDMSGGNTNQFHDLGAVCFRTCDEIQGWGCSNFDGRTVKVNGKEIKCGESLPAKVGPFYYFDVSAGAHDYASIYWWGVMYGIPAGGFKKWDGSSTPVTTPDAGAADGPAASGGAP